MSRFRYALSMVLAATLISAATATDATWPAFRGTDQLGMYTGKPLPTQWSANDIKWRTQLDGVGFSSPCIWNEHTFVTAAKKTGDNVTRVVICLNTETGKVLWQKDVSTGPAEDTHAMNGYASPTCATDGQRVVSFFGRGGIHCHNMDGEPLWSHDLGTFPGGWGTAASPIILNGKVIQNCDAAGPSFLTAFDAASGKVVWKTPRGSPPRGGWNTPLLIETPERKELIVHGEHGIRGYDPATGKELWFCKGFNGRGTPIPAWHKGLLLVINGKPGDAFAVKPGGSGDVTKSHMAWHTKRSVGRDCSSPVVAGGMLFVVSMKGIATAYDAANGKQLWQSKLKGIFTASPIVAGGLIYIQNEAGDTYVIEPSDTLKVKHTNTLGKRKGELFRGSMAAVDGRLYFRSTNAVYCIGK